MDPADQLSEPAFQADVYAESSAVMAWLQGENEGQRARLVVESARAVYCSELTIIECERALIRAVAMGLYRQDVAAVLRVRLHEAVSSWSVVRLLPEILARAIRPFPLEPIRTLDAIHVATALHLKSILGDFPILSLDDRIRRVAEALGFPVRP
ncbi:MAG: type II toxin-antitoxin system VapC family toxin [Rhodospirillaceae bacterium]|nr:type II toxin-antitoxin system VapC family toxin [Rhodospirillaceae bacterium]